MTKHKLSLEIPEKHPAYTWAKKQSDAVNAIGHIGTHTDCYTALPDHSDYILEAIIMDCSTKMPSAEAIKNTDLKGKALILFTGVLNAHGYGTKEYGAANTFLSEATLDAILQSKPAFILIDACGIGRHGEEHIKFDKKCEANGCFVIENILLTESLAFAITELEIQIDLACSSTGKPCRVHALETT
ncbi:hypothetical protein DMA11_05465 [Marinilabiliaceae bacterium JC017]|nr:hypothetical protein DMA11_05465 [Marinilabiliaceae bacterium JC017]